MSSLRGSSRLTNLVADTIRFRDLSGGILTLSEKGVVRNDGAPAFQTLTVSGQVQLHDTTVFGTLTANAVHAVASITSPVASVGSLDVSSAVITYLSQFDPSGQFFSLLPQSASIGDIITTINDLLLLFYNRKIFVLLSPRIYFQTTSLITFYEFPSDASNNLIACSYEFNAGGNAPIEAIIESINNKSAVFNIKFRLLFNATTQRVTIQEAPGYSFTVTDTLTYGSANLFLNHIGLIDLSGSYPADATYPGAFYPYTSVTGSPVVDPTGVSPLCPTAPVQAPNLSGSALFNGFTITFPSPSDPSVKQIDIYLDISGSPFGIQSWDLVPASASSYTFLNLSEQTTYNVSLTYLSVYDESPRSPALTVTTSSSIIDVSFNVLSSPHVSLSPPSSGQTTTILLTLDHFWDDLSLNNISQIQSMLMSIGYQVLPGAAATLTTTLNAVVNGHYFPVFTQLEHAPYYGPQRTAQGGLFLKTYVSPTYNQWVPTDAFGNINKSQPLQFAWTFSSPVTWVGQGTFDTFFIYYNIIL